MKHTLILTCLLVATLAACGDNNPPVDTQPIHFSQEDKAFWSEVYASCVTNFNPGICGRASDEAVRDRQMWYLNGRLHRVDGPAVFDGDYYQLWYLNDRLHREDGPAVIDTKFQQYWLNGEQVTEADLPSK